MQEIISHPDRRMEIFRAISANQQGFLLLHLSKRIQKDILSKLGDDELIEAVEFLDPDETTDILQNISERRQKRILKRLDQEIREKVEFLLKFNPHSAAGIMSLDYIELNENISFAQLGMVIKRHEKRTGRVPTILVVDNGILKGEIPAYILAITGRGEKVFDYIKRVPTVRYNQSESEVISVFKKHPHNKVVVLDDNQRILGIIYSDDILRLVEKEYAKSLSGFAGVREEEDVLDTALTKVKYRYKWLIINLGTAFLAASVVGLFEDVISSFTLLAAYMPVVAGMGGNAGTQTLAVVVRGLTLKEVNFRNAGRVITNEMIAGGINGAITGLLVALVAAFWNKNPLLGLVVGISLVANLIIAGLFGAIIPLLMKRLKKDPASSATIFITTATDVCGFFVFLGLAALVL